jgi:hypothetical protein
MATKTTKIIYGPCAIEGCANGARKTRPTCALCGANIGNWARRRPAHLLAYRQKLVVRTHRMAEVVSVGAKKK